MRAQVKVMVYVIVYIPGSKPSLSTTCIESVLVNRRADDRVVDEVIACKTQCVAMLLNG